MKAFTFTSEMGINLGTYEAETVEAAWAAMNKDAGNADFKVDGYALAGKWNEATYAIEGSEDTHECLGEYYFSTFADIDEARQAADHLRELHTDFDGETEYEVEAVPFDRVADRFSN